MYKLRICRLMHHILVAKIQIIIEITKYFTMKIINPNINIAEALCLSDFREFSTLT